VDFWQCFYPTVPFTTVWEQAEPRAILLAFGVAPSGSSTISVMEWIDPIPPIPPILATTLILIGNNTYYSTLN